MRRRRAISTCGRMVIGIEPKPMAGGDIQRLQSDRQPTLIILRPWLLMTIALRPLLPARRRKLRRPQLIGPTQPGRWTRNTMLAPPPSVQFNNRIRNIVGGEYSSLLNLSSEQANNTDEVLNS